MPVKTAQFVYGLNCVFLVCLLLFTAETAFLMDVYRDNCRTENKYMQNHAFAICSGKLIY